MGMLEQLVRFVNNVLIDRVEDNTAGLLVMGGPETGKTVSVITAFTMLTRGVSPPSGGPCLRFNADTWNSAYVRTAHALTEAYMAMDTDGVLPVGTTENHTYEFRLEKNNMGICKLTYLDYRGGIRSDTDPSEEEVAAFQSVLKQATMLAFILPGDVLRDFEDLGGIPFSAMTSENRARYVRINREVSHIRTQMVYADEVNPDAALLFYITKADYLPNPRSVPDILDRFLRTWGILGSGRAVLGCASTLGEEINIDGNHMILDGLHPRGFELPMLLAAMQRLSLLAHRWEVSESRSINESIEELNKQLTAEKAHKVQLEAQMRTKVLQFFGGERKDLTESNEKIQNLKKMLADKDKQKAKIADRSSRRKHVRDILTYIQETYQDEVLYLDSTHKKQPLHMIFQ